MPDSDDTNRTVARELQQARQALDDATKGRAADLSDAAVINRLYYAPSHAVQGVLYGRGFEPTSHGGVLSLFGSEIIGEMKQTAREIGGLEHPLASGFDVRVQLEGVSDQTPIVIVGLSFPDDVTPFADFRTRQNPVRE